MGSRVVVLQPILLTTAASMLDWEAGCNFLINQGRLLTAHVQDHVLREDWSCDGPITQPRRLRMGKEVGRGFIIILARTKKVGAGSLLPPKKPANQLQPWGWGGRGIWE